MFRTALLASAVALGAGEAAAQQPPPPESIPAQAEAAADSDGRTVFDSAFFARFAPRTALDLVQRVPGFTLDEGEDRRGLAGAAGNVLIDGEPPSSKSEPLRETLARIPASQVVRVELLRGAAAARDGGVQAVLVNVVRAPSAGAGVWQGEAEHGLDARRTVPRGSASWNGRAGRVEYGVGTRRYAELRPVHGFRTLHDGAGLSAGGRIDVTPFLYRESAVTAEIAGPLFGGRARANAQLFRSEFRSHLDSAGFDAAGAPNGDFVFLESERQQSFELGGSFNRALGAGTLEITALATRGAYADDQDTADASTAISQRQRNDSAESIVRAVLTWPLGARHRLQAGAEAALNALETDLELSEDSGGGPTPIALPAANVTVEETRAEAFVTHLWRPSPRWSIETTAAAERSRLTQSGDTNLVTELVYFKPSLQITRTFGARQSARLRLYRDIGQLDFDDFASAAELSDVLVAGGNPDLKPETSWRVEAAADLRFAADGALSVTLFHWEIEDATDVVPVGPPGAQFDAPGNIGEGVRDGVTITGALPLGAVLPGARLTFDATFQRGEVTDPVTGRARTITGLRETTFDAEFRQDLPALRFAWGAAYHKESESLTFRLNEVDTFEEGPWLDLYAETTALAGLKLRLTAASVLDSPFRRERRFSTPDRTGALARVERRERRMGSFLTVTLSGTF